MLFATTIVRKRIMPTKAALSMFCVTLKDRVSLFNVFIRVFSAKTKIKPTVTVTVNFTTTKAGRLLLTKLAMSGLSSTVPKYSVPITVVKQSIEPIKINNRLETYFTEDKLGQLP